MADEHTPQVPAASRAPDQSARPGQPAHDDKIPVRLILLGALVVYLIVFAVLNSRNEKISFVFFSIHVSLIVGLVVAAALGFFGGYLGNELRDRRKRRLAETKKSAS